MTRTLAGGAAGLLVMTACAAHHPPAPDAAAVPTTSPSAKTGQDMKQTLQYPTTRAGADSETRFGVTVDDPYRWLEDATSTEVKGWMAAEDRIARDWLARFPGRDRLEARLRELYYVDSISAPLKRGNRYFYKRTHADREKAVLYWREGENGDERVLIDPNALSKDSPVSLGSWSVTYDGRTIAYSLKPNNADEATMYVMDVDTGRKHDIDTIPGAKYATADWTPSGDGFYYTRLPVDPSITVADRPGYAEIRFHRLGTDPAKDELVHEKTGDPRTFIGADLSRDGRWLFAAIVHGWNAVDLYYRDLQSKDRTWKPFVVGNEAHYQVIAWRNRFYILTDEGAPRFRMFAADPAQPARDKWREIVPEAPDSVIEGFQIVGEHLVITRLKNASNTLEVRTLEGALVRSVPLPELGSTGGMAGNPDEDGAFFAFTSFLSPMAIYRTSIRTGETSQWASIDLPIDASPYQVQQVWYPSKDGTRVSMFIVGRKDMPMDGSTPFILTGYGGFNVSMTPAFSSGKFPWLEAGGAYAIPNLRGGGEYGEAWHRGGMLANKQNVFDDFIGAAEFLIDKGYTKPERLAISGGSNGGLLVGAAMTQRPDLFRAVICAVPLLDMVRYHLFGSGKTWISEYGSADDEAQFKTLHAYSPYHHVKPGTAYPSLLMMSADSDDRVDPMHARKMTARLQAADPRGNPILLRIEANSGHGGADMVKSAVAQSVDSFSFLMRELGMTPAAATATGK